MRSFIRECRQGTEWSSGVGDLTEVELARGKILARELSGPGSAHYHAKGKLQVPNGASGNLLLRLYTISHLVDAAPAVARGSMSNIALHTVPIAAPGAPAGQGILLWDFEMHSLGVGSMGSSQTWFSRVRYQRGGADPLTTHETFGQINADFHPDTTWLFTMQKQVGGGSFINTLLDVFSQDAYVRNGEDGMAS